MEIYLFIYLAFLQYYPELENQPPPVRKNENTALYPFSLAQMILPFPLVFDIMKIHIIMKIRLKAAQ